MKPFWLKIPIFGTKSDISRVLAGLSASYLVVGRYIHVILCDSYDSAISHFFMAVIGDLNLRNSRWKHKKSIFRTKSDFSRVLAGLMVSYFVVGRHLHVILCGS